MEAIKKFRVVKYIGGKWAIQVWNENHITASKFDYPDLLFGHGVRVWDTESEAIEYAEKHYI